jgi:F-type H+-transporting ATPase subunit gamma
MPNLKDLKNRIASVKNTRKITKAMQMVAAAKLRRAQEAAEQSRPYTERFNAVMSRLAASVGGSDSAPKLLSGTGENKVHLLVVMTAERGLCGGFNANIAKLAKIQARRLIGEGKEVKILTVGKKGRDSIRREFAKNIVGHVDLTDVKRIGYADAQGIAKDVLGRFDATTSPAKKPFWLTCCRAALQRRSSRLCWKMRLLNRARGCLQWTTRLVTPVI